MKMLLGQITGFLNTIDGWADETAVESAPRPGLHVITIKKGKFTYMDQYGGGEPFQGLETIWRGKRMVWMMSYRGKYTGKAEYSVFITFLKSALRFPPKTMPVRGPNKFTKEKFPGWSYKNECNGSIGEFKGKEEIRLNGIKVYSAEYSGGLIDTRDDI